jgi:hypothetical protein
MINNEQGDLDKLKKLALADNAIIRRLAAILTVRNSCDKQRVALLLSWVRGFCVNGTQKNGCQQKTMFTFQE